MKDLLISSARAHCIGLINRHMSNMEVMLSNPAAIADHQDVQSAIEKELDSISRIDGRLQVIAKYFTQPDKDKTPEEKPAKK